MIVYDQFEQYTDEYWRVRRGVPTCSEFEHIIAAGGKPSKCDTYIHQLVAEVFDPHYPRLTEFATPAMRNGTRMEPKARELYEMLYGPVKQIGFYTTDDGRFGGSPDALVGDDGVLEIKSPDPKTHIGYLDAGELPSKYKPQVHGHLVISGRKWCDFMSYVEGFPEFRVRVEPDDYTADMRKAIEAFWPKYQQVLGKIRAMGVPESPKPTEEPIIF